MRTRSGIPHARDTIARGPRVNTQNETKNCVITLDALDFRRYILRFGLQIIWVSDGRDRPCESNGRRTSKLMVVR